MEVELNLKVLVNALLKHLIIILAVVLIVSLAVGIYTAFFVAPVYTASTTSLVMVDDLNATQNSNISTTINIMSTYARSVLSDKTMKFVSDYIKNQEYTPQVITSLTTATYDSGGIILYITAMGTTPENAQLLANAVTEAAQRTVDIASLQVINSAQLPSSPSSPSLVTNVFLAAVISFVLAYGICLVIDLYNTKIVSESQLSTSLGLPVIGVIPVVDFSDERIEYVNSSEGVHDAE